MTFTWADGFTKEFVVGDNIRGLQHERQRPLTVAYTDQEIFDDYYGKRPPTKEMEAKLEKYMSTEVYLALQ